MRRASGLALLLAFFLPAATPVAAADSQRSGHYVLTFGGGVSHFSEYRDVHDDGSLSDVQVEERDNRFQGSLGFAGRYLGIEFGYESIGRVRLDAVSDGTGPRWLAGRLSARLSGYGFSGSALLRAPAGDRWVTQLRAGLLQWRTTEHTSAASGLVTTRAEHTGTSFVVGAGGELRIAPDGGAWLRLEATRSEVGEQDLAYYTVSGSVVLHR